MYDTLQIDQKLVEYASRQCEFPREWASFEEEFVRLWVVQDFALEAKALRPEDVFAALAEAPGRHYAERDLFLRVRQAHHGFQATLNSARRNSTQLSQDLLKEVHQRVCRDGEPAAGRCRKHNQQPTGYDHDIVKAASLNYHIRKLVQTANTELVFEHPVVGAALIHLEFLRAWPFDARTGRAGRLLLNQWLVAAGYPPALLTGFDRQAYFSALRSESPEPMIQLISEAVNRTMSAAERYFRRSIAA